MFTSEPSLAQRIGRMIGDTPIIDARSGIWADRPNEPDLAALILNGAQGRNLLRSAGMPHEDLDDGLPPDERVRRSLPYLARVRNTTAAWCLFRIFRDLYDFGDPDLTEANYRDLFDKVAATSGDPAWTESVLRGRCNIRGIVAAIPRRPEGPSRMPIAHWFRLDIGDLFRTGVRPELYPTPEVSTARTGAPDLLTEILREGPTSTDQVDRLVFDYLDRMIVGPVKFAEAYVLNSHRFEPPGKPSPLPVVTRDGGRELSDDEADALDRSATWAVLRWHHENRRAFQFALGSDRRRDGDWRPAPPEEAWASEASWVFPRFPDARFEILTGAPALTRDVALLAARRRNVFASTHTGQDFSPMTIEQSVAFRVQLAPMTKVVGFASEARSAEWTYGLFQVFKKATASALARLVEAGYYEEDEVPPLLRQIFHDTPRDLYGLGGD